MAEEETEPVPGLGAEPLLSGELCLGLLQRPVLRLLLHPGFGSGLVLDGIHGGARSGSNYRYSMNKDQDLGGQKGLTSENKS